MMLLPLRARRRPAPLLLPPVFQCCAAAGPTPITRLQQRCMYCIRGAFADMQQDLAPLGAGAEAAAAAAQVRGMRWGPPPAAAAYHV